MYLMLEFQKRKVSRNNEVLVISYSLQLQCQQCPHTYFLEVQGSCKFSINFCIAHKDFTWKTWIISSWRFSFDRCNKAMNKPLKVQYHKIFYPHSFFIKNIVLLPLDVTLKIVFIFSRSPMKRSKHLSGEDND